MSAQPYSVHLLDHGYLTLIRDGCWGSDQTIVEAARMSTDGAFRGWGPLTCPKCSGAKSIPDAGDTDIVLTCDKCKGTGQVPGDEKLLRTLWEGRHTSPFEQAGATFEIQAPIFVFREWHRHRTQSYNEMSGRYTVLPDLYYVPSVDRLMNAAQSKTNRQSSGAGISEIATTAIQGRIRESYEAARADYEALLASGVAREVARVVLPVAQYSRMRASANLHNWFRFLTLRTDPAAQFEIREYAAAVSVAIEKLFPRCYDLWFGSLGR